MNEILAHLQSWMETARDNPLATGAIVLAVVGFWVVSNWKPRSTRQAEGRLREIRDESHDLYRHQRPPGR
jgi:hypothetical protein